MPEYEPELEDGYGALVERAKMLMEIERYSQAVSVLLEALQVAPEDGYAQTLLASCHINLERFEEGLRYAERALAADPEYGWAHFLRCHALGGLGRMEEAVSAARQAVHYDPEEAGFHWKAGMLFLHTKRVEEAETTAHKLIKLHPETHFGYELLAQTRFLQKRYSETEEYSRRALAINPDTPWSHSALGSAFHQQERYEEAIKAHYRAAQLAPTDSNIIYVYTQSVFAFLMPPWARKWYIHFILFCLILHTYLFWFAVKSVEGSGWVALLFSPVVYLTSYFYFMLLPQYFVPGLKKRINQLTLRRATLRSAVGR